MRFAVRTEDARPGRGEDRALVVELDGHLLFAVVDGAGGVGRGAEAADAACSALKACAWLRARDRELALFGGLAAAVVLDMHESGTVRGASVGDCEARVFAGGRELASLLIDCARLPSGALQDDVGVIVCECA